MALVTPAPRVLADALPRSVVRDVLLVLGGAAFVGLAAQVSFLIPSISPVPFTGQTFAVLLTGAALGSVRGGLSMLVYMVAGMAGVPWFAEGGTAVSEGALVPSFGFILGFVVAGALVGRLAELGWTRTPLRTAAAMIVGNAAIYLVGVAWLKFALAATWAQAIAWGMTPFLIGDLIKVALAAGLLPLAWLGLRKAGLVGDDKRSA